MNGVAQRLAALSPRQRALMVQRLRDEGIDLAELQEIAPAGERPFYPLSFAQRRLWFLEQLTPGSAIYVVPLALRMRGRVRPATLRRSLQEVVLRHQVLRASFPVLEGEPAQVVRSPEGAELPSVDLGGLPEEVARQETSRLLAEESWRPFDLLRGPVWRALLVRHEDEEHTLLLTFHHLVFDYWSIAILLRELAGLYAGIAQGRPADLTPLPIQYPDFAVWQRIWLDDAVLDGELGFWRETLRGAPPVLELPLDRPRPKSRSFRGASQLIAWPATLVDPLKELARRSGATLFMVLLSAFKTLLLRLSGQADLSVGTPAADRTRAELEALIGCFINTLVLRTGLQGDPAFPELLQRVRGTVLDAQAHRNAPFDSLVQELQPERNLGVTPLFQVVFVLQNAPQPSYRMGDISLRPVEVASRKAEFDLILSVWEEPWGIQGWVEFATDIFDAETIRRWTLQLRTLLSEIARYPAQRLSALPLLTRGQRHQVLCEWNDTATTVPVARQRLIHQLFEQRAAGEGDAVALVSEAGSLTYRELNRRANRLAHALRRLGLGAGALVAVHLRRSPEMVIAVLGILKAGGAYVPLDTHLPAARVRWILSFLEIRCLIVQEEPLAVLRQGAPDLALEHCVLLDGGALALDPGGLPETDPEPVCGPEALAYVIFTSGSTGTPKGVVLQHGPVLNLIAWVNGRFGVGPADRVLFVTSLGFDLSVYDIFGLLAAGGSIHIASESDVRDPERLVRLLLDEPITYWDSAPAALQQLVPFLPSGAAGCGELRLVFLSGDWIPVTLPDRVRGAFPRARVIGLGGATEAAIWSNFHAIDEVGPDWRSIPYGWPIQNARYHVLDSRLEPVPLGVAGDLYIGGPCLASCYAREPVLTATKLVPDPFGEAGGERIYRTGDRARRWAGGTIEFLGRLDDQVKLRGFRIELAEIETVLAEHPDVLEAAAMVREDEPGDRRLVAYFVAAGTPEPTARELRAWLAERLPEYMVPAAFVPLPALPLTPNAKVDRRALPAPDPAAAPGATTIQPRDEIEELIASLWAGVLRLPAVGIHDSFFEAGGQSILATQLVSRLREVFGVEVPLRSLFEAPTVAGLAAQVRPLLTGGAAGQLSRIERAPRTPDLPLSFAQQRLWLVDRLEPGNAAYNVPAAVRLQGVLDVAALERSLDEIVQRHEVLRTTFGTVEGRPVQVIVPGRDVRLPFIDLAALPERAREREARRLADEEARRPFDLATGPLFRFALARLGADDHVALLTLHHIVSDGTSVEILLRDLAAVYGARRAGQPSPLPELPIQYADFAVWQNRWLPAIEPEQLAYWMERLSGAPPILELPTDRPRPAIQSFRGAVLSRSLPGALTAAFAALGAREGTTLFMGLLAGFAALLFRYTGQRDLLVGVPIANRNRVETEGLVGFFVNTLVVRIRPDWGVSARELLRQVRDVTLGAYAHQELPFEKLLEDLQPERSLSHHPLFQVMFTVQRDPRRSLELPALALHTLETGSVAAKFDQSLFLFETMDGLAATLEYRTDLFDGATIARLLEHLATLLEAIAADPEQGLERLPLLTAPERQQLQAEWNDTATDGGSGLAVPRWFEGRAAAAPDTVALVFAGQSLTYGELNRQANRMARLLQRHGVGPEDRVGLCRQRSMELVVAVLAIFKAGGAYVPLDPGYPEARLAFMLEDAGISVLLTEGEPGRRLGRPGLQVVDLEESRPVLAAESGADLAAAVPRDRLAYMIYTSGSTGLPKAVMVEHGSLEEVLRAAQGAFGWTASDRTPCIAPFSFDISLFELLSPLLAGGTCVLLPAPPALEIDSVLAVLEDATVFHAVPALMQQVVQEARQDGRGAARFRSLRQIFVGGDRVPPELLAGLAEVFPGAGIRILYGPTEGTMICASCAISDVETVSRALLGRPLPGASMLLCDERGNLVPLGIPGEIHLGGPGVARGYWQREPATAGRFVVRDGRRFYRTGDRARHLPDGTLEFLGRTDHQVKVRGFRLDLGEIEAVVREHPAVADAVVTTAADRIGERRLVSYVVPARQAEELELWPSTGEYDVYDELIYYGLTEDEPRNDAYRRVLRRLAVGKVVVDVGTGAEAILARLAIEAGAARVYAVEISERACEQARRRLASLGLADRVTVIQGDARRIELPGKADVCVSEIVEALGGAEGAAVILDAARRLLGPGGTMIPQRSVTRIAAVRLPDEILDDLGFTEVSAHYVRKIFQQVGQPFDLRLCVKGFPPAALISESGIFEDLDFTGPAAEQVLPSTLTVQRSSRLDGFLAWLELHLADGERLDILAGSYSWFPVYFPIFHPGIEVQAGDTIELECATRQSDDGVHPDYELRGRVVRRHGGPVPFAHTSTHHRGGYRESSFYQELFRAGEIPVRQGRRAADLPRSLRRHLAARLPDFMVPSAFVSLGSLPLTPNGKVDRAALPPLPDAFEERPRADLSAPRTATEQVLARLWAEVLEVPAGLHDNFFELGGHSLLATQVTSRIRQVLGVEVPLRALFETPTVARLAEVVDASRSSVVLPPVTRRAEDERVPLSFSQQRLWFLDQLDPGSPAYNVAGWLRLTGRLDAAALAGALSEVVRRHEILRTSFGMVEDSSVQVIAPPSPWRLPTVDLSALSPDRAGAESRRVAHERAWAPFDLSRGPLLRTVLLRLADEEHSLLFSVHHIVSDAWSMGILLRELAAILPAFAARRPSPLPELPVQYGDYALWQRRWLTGEVLEEQMAYWRQRLAGSVPVLDLPTDRPRPAVQTFHGAFLPFRWPSGLLQPLAALARRERATPFMLMLLAFQILLFHLARQRRFCIASPIAGRTRLEIEGLIGFFANTLVLRADLTDAATVRELLAQVRETTLGAYAHQDVPFERLIEELQPERRLDRSPLSQVMIASQSTVGEWGISLPGPDWALLGLENPTAKFDLSLLLDDLAGAPSGGFEYNTDLFDRTTADRWSGHLLRLLEALAADPDRRALELPLLSAEENHQLLREWSATVADAGSDRLLHELFEEQAALRPDSVALVSGEQRLTYRELDVRASRLALRLRAYGVEPETRVGICAERTAELVVGVLATLKADGAYVPLDPAYPKERLALILADARVTVLLAQENLLPRLPEHGRPVVALAGSPAAEPPVQGATVPAISGNLAYLIYTSGSTGRPKGVAIEHRSAVALVRWAADAFTAAETAGVLASTSLCFDLSVFELFVPLSRGGKVILAANALELPLLSALAEISLINTVPSAAAELARSGGLPDGVRTVNLAGEPLQRDLVQRLYSTDSVERVLNLYGPSEDTTYSTAAVIAREDRKAPGIGRPVTGTRAYLLDEELRPVPVGVPGELCLAGDGLARGYFDRPDLTASVFVPDPFAGAPGERLYRTGDLARFRADGSLEFLGRRDGLVKVRGFRIEVGEVEAVLAGHPGIGDAVVIAREDVAGERRLVAYAVPAAGQAPTPRELREHLASTLPEFMVPTAFVLLATLPRMPNGKVDRRALPAPGPVLATAEPARSRTPLEEVLATLWGQVLGGGPVGVEESFFDLGGHSLLAAQLMSRVRTACGVDLPLRALFERPTVAGLAAAVEAALAGGGRRRQEHITPVPRGAGLPLSLAQQRLWFLYQLEPDNPAYSIPLALRLTGALDVPSLQRSLDETVRRHEALRTSFYSTGPSALQVVEAPALLALPLADLTGLTASRQEREMLRLAWEEAERPFDLGRAPLLRSVLLRVGEAEHLLLITMHHIVSDGWSIGVLSREIAALYAAFSAGHPSPLPEPRLQYADFAHWQRERLRGELLQSQIAYWRARLAGAPPHLELPADFPRSAGPTRGASESADLDPLLAAGLETLARQEGVTLFMALLAAFQALLSLHSGQEDVLVGSPVAGRNREELEEVVGFFVNTLVFRTDLSGGPSFETLLARVREVALGAYAHQDLPFERLVEELEPQRTPGRNPIFQVLLDLLTFPSERAELPALAVESYRVPTQWSKFDLTLFVEEVRGTLRFRLDYRTDLFKPATIRRLLADFATLLAEVVAAPDRPISTLLSLAETHGAVTAGFSGDFDEL